MRMHARDAPLSVMLDGQKYRHVDNVNVCDNGGMKNFTAVCEITHVAGLGVGAMCLIMCLQAWQNKGMAEQCVVWLYSKYVPYDAFEDGTRAEVHAVYEPPQVTMPL